MARTISFQTLIIALLLVGMGTMGFQCSSPNITSARMYYQQKKYDKAEEVLKKEIKQNPNNAEAWYWMGIVQGTKNEFSKLVESWDRSLQISNQMKSKIEENSPYFWGLAFNYGAKNLQKARITKREKEFKKAIEGFEAAIKLLPDSSAKYGAYLNLGLVYLNQGKQDKAIEPLTKSVEIEKFEQSYEILGQIYLAQGTDLKKSGKTDEAKAAFEKAIEVFNQGIGKYPDSDNLRINLIQAYVKADRTEEAIEQYEKEVSVHPNDKIARYNLGVLYMEAENFEKSILHLKKALEIDPEYENALYNITVAYVNWGVIIRKKLEDEDVENKKIDTRQYLEKFEKALPYLEKLLTMRQDDEVIWDLAGKLYTSLNMLDKAKEAYEKADELKKAK